MMKLREKQGQLTGIVLNFVVLRGKNVLAFGIHEWNI